MNPLDPLLNWLTQLQLMRRREKADWLVAARFVAYDLRRAIRHLHQVLDLGFVPPMDGSFLSTPGWDDYGAVFARSIPNNDEGDGFWLGMSELMDNVRDTRALLSAQAPGTPIAPAFANSVLLAGIEALRAAYENLVSTQPQALIAESAAV